LKQKISRQVLNKHLNRLIKHYIIAELEKDKAISSFIKHYRGTRLKDKAQRIYFYIPISKKFYEKLIKKCSQNGKNDKLIKEICAFYRYFEVFSIAQKILLIDKRIVKRVEKAHKRDYSEIAITKNIRETKKEIGEAYKKRKEQQGIALLEKFTAPLNMDKYMFWIFNYNHKNMIKSSDKMINKMVDLFNMVYPNSWIEFY